MKKQYVKIQTKVVRLNPSELICVSAGVNNDPEKTTDVMHSRQGDFDEFDYFEDNIWD